MRTYSRQTITRLIIGGIVVLIVVGIGLVWIFYGKEAALSALICIGLGMLPLWIILIVFFLITYILKKNAGN